MTWSLAGKTILFFGPQTFGYEVEIAEAMRRNGASVFYRSDKPNQSLLSKVFGRLVPKLLWLYSDQIFAKWLADLGPNHCDMVLVVKGEGLSPAFIDKLRAKYPHAIFILYLWDSIRNIRSVEAKIPKFDFAYSFDPIDCQANPKLKYRSLFFLTKFLQRSPVRGNGCFFIGTLNGDRPAVIAKVANAIPSQVGFDYWLFVRSEIELRCRKIIDKSLASLDNFRLLRRPMTVEMIREKFSLSCAILDIEHPNQNGLTMRTFEVLASGKKLITTNSNIGNCDFFDSKRICVINRDHPILSESFFNSDPLPLPDSFFEKYSLDGWLKEILGECRIQTSQGQNAQAHN